MADGIIDIDELSEQYEEHGFFRRIGDMLAGFKQPKDSRDYKLALIELQRLKAPIIAIVAPILGVIVLIVVTAVSAQQREHIEVEISNIEDKVEDLDEPEPEPEEIDMTEDVDVTVDVVTPDIVNPAPPSPDPGGEPDKVAQTPSPVVMRAMNGAPFRGIGDGTEGGFGTLIKGGQNVDGCLIGVLVDLKRDGEGNPRTPSYWNDVSSAVAKDFSPESLANFYVVPKKVALTHVFIPMQDAGNGPKAFGAGDQMKPKEWFAYYTGEIKATEKARYRFAGFFDDCIMVRIDGKTVFECVCDHMPGKSGSNKSPMSGWGPSDQSVIGEWRGPRDRDRLVVGDWFAVEPGKKFKMDLVIGERPGGIIGGLLLIQKEGEEYPKDGNRPILPIFASRPLSVNEKDRIGKNSYKIGVDSPRFNSRGNSKAKEKMVKDDVSVGVDI